jgi:hypothetical protein
MNNNLTFNRGEFVNGLYTQKTSQGNTQYIDYPGSLFGYKLSNINPDLAYGFKINSSDPYTVVKLKASYYLVGSRFDGNSPIFIDSTNYLIYFDIVGGSSEGGLIDTNSYSVTIGYEKADIITNGINANIVIQEALDNLPALVGGTIFLKKGIYNLSATLLLAGNISIIGEDRNLTILKLNNNVNDDVIRSIDFDTLSYTGFVGTNNNNTIANLTIDGNAENQTASGNADPREQICGIKKYGSFWNLKNLNIFNCREIGIYSEFTRDSNLPGDPNRRNTNDKYRHEEDNWSDIRIRGYNNYGIVFRGPHDSLWSDIITFSFADSPSIFTRPKNHILIQTSQANKYTAGSLIGGGVIHTFGQCSDKAVKIQTVDGTARSSIHFSLLVAEGGGNSGYTTIGDALSLEADNSLINVQTFWSNKGVEVLGNGNTINVYPNVVQDFGLLNGSAVVLGTTTATASGITGVSGNVININANYSNPSQTVGVPIGFTKPTNVVDLVNDFGNTINIRGFTAIPTMRCFSDRGIRNFNLTSGGSGYTPSATFAVTFTGGSPISPALGLAKTNSSGVITEVYLTDCGEGFTSAPTPVFTAGGGTGATGICTLSGTFSINTRIDVDFFNSADTTKNLRTTTRRQLRLKPIEDDKSGLFLDKMNELTPVDPLAIPLGYNPITKQVVRLG